MRSNATHEATWPTPLRSWRMWTKGLVSYFPHAEIHKSVELSPEKSYMFCYHPHGIFTIGGWLAFGTEALGWSKLFPGIDVRILTLNLNFNAPILREYLLLHGVCSCDKESIIKILNRGKSVLLVVGGGSESMHAAPGRYDIVLRRRRGFVKVALRTGTSLVPCIGFGEPDLFDSLNERIPPGAPIRRVQRTLTRVFGFAIPLATGRGLLGGSGVLPNPTPLDIVIGEPLIVPKWTGDAHGPEWEEAVDVLHEKYMKATIDLYHKHQQKYARGASDIRVVE